MTPRATLQAFSLDKLSLFHRNARRGDVSAIKTSLLTNDQYAPITVNAGSLTGRPNEVLAGNHTLMAMRELAIEDPADTRWKAIDCYVIDVDDAHAVRINLNPNKLARLGGFDEAELVALLSDFDDDLIGTGYTDTEFKDLVAMLGDPAELADMPDPVIQDETPATEDPAPAPSKKKPAASSLHNIVLEGLPERHFAWMRDKLTELRNALGVETDAEVVFVMLIEKTGERPPAQE
jgi:ParB-like chromosome segregation protein Spo0J